MGVSLMWSSALDLVGNEGCVIIKNTATDVSSAKFKSGVLAEWEKFAYARI
jgi:hypothetical protein